MLHYDVIDDYDYEPEVLVFKTEKDLIHTVQTQHLDTCNTYFDPSRGWILEKLN